MRVPMRKAEFGRTLKIRLRAERGQNFIKAFAPDDAALAEPVFARLFLVGIAPDFAGEGSHFVVTCWKIFKTRRTRWRQTNNRCPGLYKAANSVQQRGPHSLLRW